ncbi:hypothetical protein N9Y67_04250 [Pseudomonadota bacterium]|nr:hypothetical protein [Pseudomonadota bacterium]
MSALTFTLKNMPAQRIDCSPLTPEELADKSVAEIAAIQLVIGNRTERVDSLFVVSGHDTSDIKLVNSLFNDTRFH